MTSQLEQFAKLFANPEELDPELAAYMSNGKFGQMIKHPLVFSLFHIPDLNAMMNAQLRAKREALGEALSAGDWHSYIWLHERPYRINGFTEIMDLMPDIDYWSLLGRIWIDSENIHQWASLWRLLLGAHRPWREHIMNDGERDALAAMPDEIVVHQGHTSKRHDGWSWTIDIEIAYWFAQRFASMEGGKPKVTTAVARKRDVIAYFTTRNESEVLIDRRLVVRQR